MTSTVNSSSCPTEGNLMKFLREDVSRRQRMPRDPKAEEEEA
jgi:hypothetical protein